MLRKVARLPLLRRQRGALWMWAVAAVLLVVYLAVVCGFWPRDRYWRHKKFPEQYTDAAIQEAEAALQAILRKPPYEPPERDQPYDFEGFDNVTGLPGEYLVPNFVHFLRFSAPELDFIDFVTVLSALKHQQPERLFFHTDVDLRGDYWQVLLRTPGFADVAEIVRVEIPTEIFGQPMDNWNRIWHASDVTRIRILMKYGGIFLDNDSYLVQSLDKFRHFEMALGWPEDAFLGTQVLVAHPDARFLHAWLETYRGAYYKWRWYYNAGQRPTEEVLHRRPELVHRVELLFGVHDLVDKLFGDQVWPGWRRQYAIHLLKRFTRKRFDETSFMHPPTTIREMILDLYDPVLGLPRIV